MTEAIARLPQDVLEFWLGDGLRLDWPSTERNPLWFGGGAAQDQRIQQQFGPLVHAARANALSTWEHTPLDRLALIILLDQFSRNVFRGQADAFAADPQAQRLSLQTITEQQDLQLPLAGRVFVYMPLMHSEQLALHEQCLHCFTQLQANAPAAVQAKLDNYVSSARQHHDIVARFGRFPHRNAILGRTSTPEEAAFLQNGPRFGQ